MCVAIERENLMTDVVFNEAQGPGFIENTFRDDLSWFCNTSIIGQNSLSTNHTFGFTTYAPKDWGPAVEV